MRISKDINGNKIVKIERSDIDPYKQFDYRGFSIQTLGNLPKTHVNGLCYETKTEIFEFIRLHGTDNQKKLVGASGSITLNDIKEGYVGRHVCFKDSLNEGDLNQLVAIIGGHNVTKCRVRSVLTYDLSSCSFWGVGDRFILDLKTGNWSYCAGQDYTYELSKVRKALIS